MESWGIAGLLLSGGLDRGFVLDFVIAAVEVGADFKLGGGEADDVGGGGFEEGLEIEVGGGVELAIEVGEIDLRVFGGGPFHVAAGVLEDVSAGDDFVAEGGHVLGGPAGGGDGEV